jgi:hypothetical protein
MQYIQSINPEGSNRVLGIVAAVFLVLVSSAFEICCRTAAAGTLEALENPSSALQKLDFNSATATNESDESRGEEILRRLSQNYDEARKAVNKLLKQPIAVEEAPSIPITCEDDPGQPDERAKAYVDAAVKPEWDLIQRLLSIQHDMDLVGMANEIFVLEKHLMERQKKKAQELMKSTMGKPEKVLAVYAFAIFVDHQMNLMGFPGEKELGLQITEWLPTSIKPLLNDLVQKHDYKKVGPLVKLLRLAEDIGSKSSTVQSFLDDLKAALSFELQLTFAIDYGAERIIESIFPVAISTIGGGIMGTGTGHYVKYWNPDVPSEKVKATDFKVTVKIENLTGCDGLATIILDRFYPDQEITVYKNEEAPCPFMKPAWQQYNADRLQNGMYTFKFKVNNLREYAIDDDVDYGGSFKTNKFTVKLIHRPGEMK